MFVQVCPKHWECENRMHIYVYPFSPERLTQMCVYCYVLHWNNTCVSGIWHMALDDLYLIMGRGLSILCGG